LLDELRQWDPTRMYWWATDGRPDRHAGGVSNDRTSAVAELAAALQAGAGIRGEVKTCYLGPGVDYVYGDVVARAEVETETGHIVWSET
jgi:hypothetical protein